MGLVHSSLKFEGATMYMVLKKLAVPRAILVLLLVTSAAATVWSQSPYFPNTTPLYYSPYGQGTYGRYGPINSLPPAFRMTQPAFMRPESALQFNYRTNYPGFYNSPYVQNNNSGSYYHPLGY